MKLLGCGLLAALCLAGGSALAQECGGSGSNGMTNCTRGDPNVPLVPSPFKGKPAGQDTSGPGKLAPPSGPPPQDRNEMRGKTPAGQIAKGK